MIPTDYIFYLAAFQGLMVVRNLTHYKEPAPLPEGQSFKEGLSVLIPARNEEHNLGRLLTSIKEQENCRFEVIVLDDHSEDSTYELAEEMGRIDDRFKVFSAPELPDGWAGKQHACHHLARHSTYDHWLYLDADVVLTDPFALARIGKYLADTPAEMVSSIPKQLTDTWAEQLVIPLIHLVLLGFLPFWEMRKSTLPALGAACGQIVGLKRRSYQKVGGHESVKHRLHDATALAVQYRRNGYITDLFDTTRLASCRMYHNSRDVFLGFAKNATEGLAQPLTLPLWTALLIGTNVVPWLLLLSGARDQWTLGAAAVNLATFLLLRGKFQQETWGALFRPAGVLLFVAIQWVALVGKWVGWKATWKGRSYQRLYQ